MAMISDRCSDIIKDMIWAYSHIGLEYSTVFLIHLEDLSATGKIPTLVGSSAIKKHIIIALFLI